MGGGRSLLLVVAIIVRMLTVELPLLDMGLRSSFLYLSGIFGKNLSSASTPLAPLILP